jgi:hypothetical protein
MLAGGYQDIAGNLEEIVFLIGHILFRAMLLYIEH